MRIYSAKFIKTHTWPVPELMVDGRWHRVWTIRLKEKPRLALERLSSAITQDVVRHLEHNSQPHTLGADFVISLSRGASREIVATLRTQEDGWSDELLFASWRMFEDIDQMLGTIETIDGQPRDNWPPWNQQQSASNDHDIGQVSTD
jgi:hypothetical protein